MGLELVVGSHTECHDCSEGSRDPCGCGGEAARYGLAVQRDAGVCGCFWRDTRRGVFVVATSLFCVVVLCFWCSVEGNFQESRL